MAQIPAGTTPVPGTEHVIVGCDIIGHSVAPPALQRQRIEQLNELVRDSLGAGDRDGHVWASGGDGGYVIFLDHHWPEQAWQLMARLRAWSTEASTGLRIAAHRGPLEFVTGADGRRQPVGDGINTAAWILSRCPGNSTVASAGFSCALLAERAGVRQRFTKPRRLRRAPGRYETIFLLAIDDEEPDWQLGTHLDYERLAAALGVAPEILYGDGQETPAERSRPASELVEPAGGRVDGSRPDTGPTPSGRRSGWDALYYAKRILQTNSRDVLVRRAFDRSPLRPSDLEYPDRFGDHGDRTINPLLGHLDPESVRDLLSRAQLVERRYNEFVCREGEYGDTLFVVLRGEVGIYPPSPEGGLREETPAFTLREGEIVGELAFAMGGRRTADVISLADTAVLAICNQDVGFPTGGSRSAGVDRAWPDRPGAGAGPTRRGITERIARFTVSRVLEHVSHRLDYLLGTDRRGPIGAGGGWREHLRALAEHTALHPVPGDADAVDLAELDGAAEGGLFVLLGGALTPLAAPDQVLAHDTLPMLRVDLTGSVVTPARRFRVATSRAPVEHEQVRILQIKARGIGELSTAARRRLVDALRRRVVRQCYSIDVFVAHDPADREDARRWQRHLRECGFTVHLETAYPDSAPGGADGRLWGALREARLVVALISARVSAGLTGQNRVLRELGYRRRVFTHPCIVPVRIDGGRPQTVLPGCSFVDATTDPASAMRTVARAVAELRNGQLPAPFALTLPAADEPS